MPFPGLGMNTILHSFHLVGVYPRSTHFLNNFVIYARVSARSCCSISGWIPSVPGDFFNLKALKASTTFSSAMMLSSQLSKVVLYIQSGLLGVGFSGVALLKCIWDKNSIVSIPDFVCSPFSLVSVPNFPCSLPAQFF